jgi:hypothetical protein
MLLRTGELSMRVKRSPSLLVVAALWILGCSPDPPAEEAPLSSGPPPIYKIIPTWCTSRCWTLTLYRSDTVIELRAHEQGSFAGLATGTLSEPASEELDQLLDEAVDLGELSGVVVHDAPLVELWLPGLTLMYDDGYPPTGLVELDAFLAKVLDDMSQCRATTQISPDFDCEPLSWFPE